MADDLQLVLSAKNDLTRELNKTLTALTKVEVALKEATTAARPDAAAEVEVLQAALKKGQDDAKRLSRQLGILDDDIEQLGGSAKETAGDMDRMNRQAQQGRSRFAGFGAALQKGALAVAAVAAAGVAAAAGLKKATDAAIGYEAKVRRTGVVFRGQTKAITRWADANNEAFGASQADVAAYLASIGDILKPLGFTTKEASRLTLGVGDLVPALAEWNTKGMDAAAVTDALTAAMTGEREMLKSLGIVISEEDVKAKVASMKATGALKGETDKQAKAIATLALATEGSADALWSYRNNSDSAGRRAAALKAAVADLRDNALVGFLDLWQRISQATRDADMGQPIKSLARAIKQNQDAIVSFVLRVMQGATKLISVWLKLESVVIKAVGYIIGGVASLLDVMAFIDPSLRDTADGADRLAQKFGDASATADRASKKMDALSQSFGDQADRANRSANQTERFGKALKALPDKVKVQFETTYESTSSAVPWYQLGLPDPSAGGKKSKREGDTSVAMGVGYLGAAGLSAAHAAFSSSLAGHRVTSGLRAHGLGSAASDHLRGRAMDVHGPRLGAYAQAVRRAGGYAAMHGSGAERHLHVVPRTRKPQRGGGDVHYHADVTVNNPRVEMDIEAAVARGIRAGARQTRERSA